jgi:hypothetical protein
MFGLITWVLPFEVCVEAVVKTTQGDMLTSAVACLSYIAMFGIGSAFIYACLNFKVKYHPDLGPQLPEEAREDLRVVFLASSFAFVLALL